MGDAAGALLPLLALASLVAEAAFGGLRIVSAVPGPTRLAARVAGSLTPRLDRLGRSEAVLAVRGGLLVLVIAGSAAAAGAVLTAVLSLDAPLRLGEALVLASCLHLRKPMDAAALGARRLDGGDAAGAAAAFGAGTRALDEHAVARFAIERLSAEVARGVAAPLFWYLVLGLAGALAYVAIVATSASLARQRSSPSFSRVPDRVDAACSAPGTLIAALLIVLGGIFVPAGRPVAAVVTLARELGARQLQSWRWPIAAAAGALGLALGGRSSYAGWIGDGTARATSRDVRRMMLLVAASCFLIAAALAGWAILLLAA